MSRHRIRKSYSSNVTDLERVLKTDRPRQTKTDQDRSRQTKTAQTESIKQAVVTDKGPGSRHTENIEMMLTLEEE